jgi:NADH-quinone oxidoreductase subunit F
MGELINDICGGLKPGRTLKAVIPGGSSAKVLKAGEKYKIKGKGADGAPIDQEIGIEDIIMDFRLARCGRVDGWLWRRDRHGRHARHGGDAE